jgi:hypothetical protein
MEICEDVHELLQEKVLKVNSSVQNQANQSNENIAKSTTSINLIGKE